MKRNKILAVLGAGVLTMGVVGAALATDLLAGQVGIKLSDKFDAEACASFPLEIGAGEIGVHFVLTSADGDSGLLDASFSTDSFTDLPSGKAAGGTVHWYAVITGDGDTTLDSASTSGVDGDNLVLSHACPGAEVSSSTESTESTESSTTSFESSVESTTESTESTESTVSSETTESTESSTTSFESSVESTTDSQSTTQPPTDTLGNSGSGQQSSGLWMLLAALGALGGSVLVLSPSKAKSKE